MADVTNSWQGPHSYTSMSLSKYLARSCSVLLLILAFKEIRRKQSIKNLPREAPSYTLVRETGMSQIKNIKFMG